MKRKRVSKSKDRDKNKTDEAKPHKHSRRKRKSSDSDSEEDPSKVSVDDVEDMKTRPSSVKKIDELENNTRSTRHSKRLAAITASSDEQREECSEVILSPAKTGKLSPYSNSSPSKECKKRDSGTPDKQRSKDQDVWKVKSANGAGSGELQKLKICRQRSPENIPLPEERQPNCVNEQQFPVEEQNELKEVDKESAERQNVEDDNEKVVFYEVNLADIELPATEFLDKTKSIGSSPIEVVKTVVENTAAAPAPSLVEGLPLHCVEEGTHSANVVKIEEKLVLQEEKQSTQISDTAIGSVTEDVDKIQLPSDSDFVEGEKSETAVILKESEMPDEISLRVPAEISEPEDVTQAEIVLTVDENPIDEPNLIAVAPENDSENLGKKETPVFLAKNSQPVMKSVDMDDVYDYENDDTREEGELSANESMSPIHEVFKKYPLSLRKRTWGFCGISHFNRSSVVVDENTLKEYNIKKRTISKEEFDASDSEDLIFVKEIREENIVHEIESETNNTSFYDRDDDDVIPSSPKRKTDNLEIKKMSLESDKIIDKSVKRFSKERALNHEGKTVLYITNLVRPFTVNQLRELLLRTGRIVEDGFWIDSIKSKCYVQFETYDEAFETRHALYGIRWPVNNPKVLNVQFATQDDLLSAQAQTHESEIPRKTEPLIISNHSADSAQKRIDWKKHFEQYDERPKKLKDVREWDIGKPAYPDDMTYAETDDSKKKVEQDSSRRSRKDKRRRNEVSDDEITMKKPRKQITDHQPVLEAKLLDDLFRRTKAAPSIYWLPLSEEQIASKQETRRKHLEDIDRQMKKHNSDHQDSRRRDRDKERRRSRR